MTSKSVEYLILLLLLYITVCVAGARRLRSSHSRPVIFPHEDPYACSTPLRQPGICVPIEHCPQLRRVGLRRLPKYICGFEHDTPLLCCEASSIPPPPHLGLPPLSLPPPPPETVRPELLGPPPPNSGPTPVPLLCTTSEREGRRWKSCWYLALQRVDFPEDQDIPPGAAKPQHPSGPLPNSSSAGTASGSAYAPTSFPEASRPLSDSSSFGASEPTTVGGSSFASSAGNRPVSSLGTATRPTKTSVTSE